MKATVKTTVKSTMTVIAAMSFVVACGSKKNAPATPADGVQPNAITTLFPGDFKGESVTCTGDVPVMEHGTYFIGNTLNFTADKKFTSTQSFNNPDHKTVTGSVAVSDEKKGEMTFKTVEIEVDGNEKPVETKSEFNFEGDTLIITAQNEELCPPEQKAVMVYKRYVKTEEKTAATPAPAAQTPAAQAEGDKKQETSKPEETKPVETAQK